MGVGLFFFFHFFSPVWTDSFVDFLSTRSVQFCQQGQCNFVNKVSAILVEFLTFWSSMH